MGNPLQITIEDMLAEVKRESALRQNVYRRWVERGTMTPQDAATHLARIDALVETISDLIHYAPGMPAHFQAILRERRVYPENFGQDQQEINFPARCGE